MIEVEIKFKKGFENLYSLTDKLFINEVGMIKTRKGYYQSKNGSNISKVLVDSVNCIEELLETNGFVDKVKSFYHKTNDEVEDVIKMYKEMY